MVIVPLKTPHTATPGQGNFASGGISETKPLLIPCPRQRFLGIARPARDRRNRTSRAHVMPQVALDSPTIYAQFPITDTSLCSAATTIPYQTPITRDARK
jgi:hypothetical protein